MGFGLGGQQNGFTIEIAAGGGNGNVKGTSTTHQETQVSGSEKLTIQSGRDTQLVGAQAHGGRVEMEVGRNLKIESQQDVDNYKSTQTDVGFNASLCIPPICYGVSSVGASASSAKTDSEYRSVREQSGITAGEGGYEIRVKGNTELTGAVIASEASADKNHLKTGTLSVRDLENEARFKSESDSASLSLSGGTPSKEDVAKGAAADFTANKGLSALNSNLLANAAGNATPDLKGKASGTTHSAISAGTIEITDEAGQQALTGKSGAETVASLNRDTAHANDGALEKIFDQQKVAAQREYQKASAELAQQLAPVVYKQVGDIAEKNDWKEGSPQKIVLHGLAGALLSALGKTNVTAGFTAAATNEALLPVMVDYLKEQGITEKTSKKDFDEYLKLGSTIIGAIAGGASSGQLSGAAIGAATAQTATTHNYLNHTERMRYLNAKLSCEKTRSADACNTAKSLLAESLSRNTALQDACQNKASSTECAEQVKLAKVAEATLIQGESEYKAWIRTNAVSLALLNNSDAKEVFTHTSEADLRWKVGCATTAYGCNNAKNTFSTVLEESKRAFVESFTLGTTAKSRTDDNRRNVSEFLTFAGTGVAAGVGSRIIDTVEGASELSRPLGQAKAIMELAQYFGKPSNISNSIGAYTNNIDTAINGSNWDLVSVYDHAKVAGQVGFDAVTLLTMAGDIAKIPNLVEQVQQARLLRQAEQAVVAAEKATGKTQKPVAGAAGAKTSAEGAAGGASELSTGTPLKQLSGDLASASDSARTQAYGNGSSASPSPGTNAGGSTAPQQELVSILHQVELGKDPAKGGKFVLDEAVTGTRIEQQVGTTLRRDPSGNGDWITSGGKVLDGASPPPSQYFNDRTFAQWQQSIQSHLNKQGVDVIVVDPIQRGLSAEQIKVVTAYIESLPLTQRSKVILLK